MKIKKNLAYRENYGTKRSVDMIKYIVVHYTANDGDSDEGNANYFHNNAVSASAHYFVDDDSITQSVPDDYVAWSVGGNLYADHASTGGGKLYKIANNSNTLNIEMCDSVKDGKIKASEATMNRTARLIREKMKRYSVDIDHVIRHFDVNGKHCPAYMMDAGAWKDFKARVLGYAVGGTYKITKASFLRKSVGGMKVDYSDLDEATKKKCKNAAGGAMIMKGKSFILEEVESKDSQVWGKTKKGYWLPMNNTRA